MDCRDITELYVPIVQSATGHSIKKIIKNIDNARE